MAVDHGTNGIAKVPQEVPAIGDLDRTRRTLADAVCVSPSTITRHHLDAGMLA